MSVNKKTSFSIVIPTYTGEDCISDCLDSILSQDGMSYCQGVVVVIDGPRESLRRVVDSYEIRFEAAGIPYEIIQFTKNRGRLEARLAGAEQTESKYVLFIDDRVVLTSGYITTVLGRGEDAVLPRVEELHYPNAMALAMGRMRNILYKRNKPIDESERYISSHNFDNLPKGTAGLWIIRDLFINICRQVRDESIDTKTVSDDTRILRGVIESGALIYRDNSAKILYQPRESLLSEIVHTYKRGPLFIDYYLHMGTRYFYPLILFYAGLCFIVILTLIYPRVLLPFLLLFFLITLLLSLVLSKKITEIHRVFSGLLLMFGSFSTGLIAGIIRKGLGR